GIGAALGAKLLLPLADGRPIIAHAVSNALALGPSEFVIVVRPGASPEIADAVDLGVRLTPSPSGIVSIRYVTNPRHEEGMATSLAAGISALGEEAEAALVMLGDMPYVAPGIVERLLSANARERKPITI